MRNRQFNIAVTLVLAFVLAACGASARHKTIRLTYEAVTIADDQLQQFKLIHGKAIVDEAKAAGKTKEQAGVELDTFIAKTDKAWLTIVAAYRMVAAAATLDDDKSLSALLSVYGLVKAQLTEIGVLK